jgi:hypothetical protein
VRGLAFGQAPWRPRQGARRGARTPSPNPHSPRANPHSPWSVVRSRRQTVCGYGLRRRWLTTVLLNNVFGGQSDNVLRDTRRVLQEEAGEPDFPLEA